MSSIFAYLYLINHFINYNLYNQNIYLSWLLITNGYITTCGEFLLVCGTLYLHVCMIHIPSTVVNLIFNRNSSVS